jgi:transmembrane sensor
MSQEAAHHRLFEDATQWLVLMHSGLATEAQRRDYQHWRNQDPRHEHLCSQLEARLGVFQAPAARGIGADVLQRTLNAPSSRRRVIRAALLGGGGLLLGAGLLKQRSLPFAELSADFHTGLGQRQVLTLADGSQLSLNAQSAANVDFDPQRRVLRLLEGELILSLAKDPRRPFFVETGQARINIVGSRLLVREREGQGLVAALAGPATIAVRNGERLQLEGGQEVAYDAFSFGQVSLSRGSATAWVDGLLELRDTPLSQVIEAIRPYRRGLLRLDPAVADLRVSGLYRLDRPEQILDTLARTLPIRISRRSDLWVTISAV